MPCTCFESFFRSLYAAENAANRLNSFFPMAGRDTYPGANLAAFATERRCVRVLHLIIPTWARQDTYPGESAKDGRAPSSKVAQGRALSRLPRYRVGNCTFVTSKRHSNRAQRRIYSFRNPIMGCGGGTIGRKSARMSRAAAAVEVIPGADPGVKWEIELSRVAATPIVTESL